MEAKAFENVKNQISYCAIWCGSCVIGNGVLKELTKRYAHLIGAYGVDEWGAEDQGFDGQEFLQDAAVSTSHTYLPRMSQRRRYNRLQNPSLRFK